MICPVEAKYCYHTMFHIDEKFPDFSLEAYHPGKGDVGTLRLEQFTGRWAVLVFYPADFTFVCPTELADMQKLYGEFQKLNAEVIGVSTDTVFTHKAWIDSEGLLKGLAYPMAADHNGRLSRELGIYDEEKGMAQRATFVLDPEGVLRTADLVSDAIGRSARETLRRLKALVFVANNPGKVCPASWDEGAPTLQPSIQNAGKVFQELQ